MQRPFIALAFCMLCFCTPASNSVHLPQYQPPPKLIKLIGSINRRLLSIRNQVDWLHEYSPKCLATPSEIYYICPERSLRNTSALADPGRVDNVQPQQPDHLLLEIASMNSKRGFKDWNELEAYPECKFSEFGSKLYGQFLIRGQEGPKVHDKLIRIVRDECRKLKPIKAGAPRRRS